ncbi:TPR end-of-group domain-containing protein [Paludisphaera soli]|uniref:TPR end-of-group domain-containing protein n=1 Tax=Paludisphaera soli TaxID=2712865 RepID=UPI0013EBD125|nr:tetratricopeptide repeat protein [Paludisphaera soli]
MSTTTPTRIRRQLDEAEGYLMLEMPQYALRILESRAEWPLMTFEANFLKGEALRCLHRHREALACLEAAALLRPEDVAVAVAQGWCYKRTNRLAEAVDALERASRQEPENPLIHYNLACYWSLAANAAKALEELATALRLRPEMRRMIADEADFDYLRGDSAFQRLVQGATPSK